MEMNLEILSGLLGWEDQPVAVTTRWRSWLRHCTTSRKVAGSIPDGVMGFFSLT
jgi:hypothetical protein